ncbi:sensor histidine kinase [Streptacidiphilus fuscans]|uniref:Oxygen sensor histidine kinase NreB n=1 Tax=Streptacidiphilus fuscans TaxID=2789292 RepID=A0A931B5H9_9ACTN|nr:sensor histidine kinase [Streptacidiphilus fuscans]MBF9069376.1 sensor histidine kinase [Streptacidiphilus fuscans]
MTAAAVPSEAEASAGARAEAEDRTGAGDAAAGAASDVAAYAEADADDQRLALVMRVAFFVLLLASLARFLERHHGDPRTPWVLAAGALLAVLYLLGDAMRARPRVWLGCVVAAWLALALLAPSCSWCAVPLLYSALRILPVRPAIVLIGLLTGCIVGSEVRLSGWDPNVLLAPPAIAALAVTVLLHSMRQTDRLRASMTELVATRGELAATERRAGMLAERQRLAAEIHDTLAQGLTSQQLLLQAADRSWERDPGAARGHLAAASASTARSLAEARRFVHDLAPADLAETDSLPDALRAVAEREGALLREGARLHVDGAPVDLPERVQGALLRVAQGALANIRRHAEASTATLTLTYLDDQVILDVWDDGRGFDPDMLPAPGPDGGHGLPAMRARLGQLGGRLCVESAPGAGTTVTAILPLGPGPAASEEVAA